MSTTESVAADKQFLSRVVEATIRVGTIAILVAWCFEIVRPFIVPVIWGMIIAIGSFPIYRRLKSLLGDRGGLASLVFAILALVIVIGPALLLAETLVGGATGLALDLRDGSVAIPPPPEEVGSWPVVGGPLEDFWLLASENLRAALEQVAPQLRQLGAWLLSTAAGAGFGILKFVFAIIIAAVLMARADIGHQAASAVSSRLAGERGREYADLARDTIRGVARGILGVALIQSLMAGLGFLVVGLPAPGLLALICLILAVIQVGVGPVVIPAIIYVFYTSEPLIAALFLAWGIIVLVLDNVLKPILLGRGARVPMLVIFLGAIGGFLSSGIIGLFVGAVVLSLGYTLFVAWLKGSADAENPAARQDAATG